MLNTRGFDRSCKDRENWNSSHILINILNCKIEHRKKMTQEQKNLMSLMQKNKEIKRKSITTNVY